MKFSIMGDSISTYEGYNPFLYDVFYTEERAALAGLRSADDTWWMQVIHAFGGELCMNDSYSGSFVAGTTPASAHSEERVSNLISESSLPDVVLICMGANDCGGKIPLHGENPGDEFAFDTTYAIMLERIKALLPEAMVFCATIMLTDEEAAGRLRYRLDRIEKYNQVIRQTAKAHGCMLLEMFDAHIGYTTVDGLHPDWVGHRLIADTVIAGLKNGGLSTVKQRRI